MANLIVVTGPPCSGKSTWIEKNMNEKDLVYDFDKLYRAITNEKAHVKNKREPVLKYVLSFRNSMIYFLSDDKDIESVYLITNDYESLKNSVDLPKHTIHEMDVTEEECLNRLKNDKSRPDKEAWAERIREWFKKERNMISKDREYRSFDFTTEEMRIEGQAVVFDQPFVYSVDGIEFKEFIDPHAFDEAKIDDVVLNIDHQGKPAAKTRNNTLKLDVRNEGVFISADLSKNATGRELYEDIKNGFYDKMSFAFTVSGQTYDSETRTRRVTKIDRVYDVSAVTFPAYTQTSISARSFFEAEALKERAEARKKEALRLKLRLRTGGNYGSQRNES